MPTMSTKTAGAEATALAEAMLQALGALQTAGGEAYPPRLRELAAQTGLPHDDDLIRAAAKKPVFTKPLDPLEKVDRAASLDGRVYLKGTRPRPDPVGDLARRMLAVLRSQKPLGPEAYPPTLRRLAELSGRNASDTQVAKAAAHQAFTGEAVVAAKAKGGKPSLDAPVVLQEEVAHGGSEVVAALLRFGLQRVATEGTGKNKGKITETTAFTPAEVQARLVPTLKPLLDGLEAALERGALPDGVAWIFSKGKPYLFLTENLRPAATVPARAIAPTAPTRPPEEFAGAFREAFDRLDRRNGATNFVKLADLRRALHEFGRDEFDTGLRALRLAAEFSLDSHEGLHGTLTPEEREAGVREAGSLLVYVSRR